MTEENYNYRTSQNLLRNQFPGKGNLQMKPFHLIQKNVLRRAEKRDEE